MRSRDNDERIYYRDRQVQVSTGAIIVDGRAFALTDLTEIWYERGRPSWAALLSRGLLTSAVGVPLALGVLAVAAGLWLRLSPLGLTIILVAGLLLGLATVPVADLILERVDRSYARGARTTEIWARWRGQVVLLLSTGDRLRFGKIYRAVQRAMEQPHLI